MDIKRAGSQPSGKGSADWFTGAVRIDPLCQTQAPARVNAAKVTFEAGARTARRAAAADPIDRFASRAPLRTRIASAR